MPKRLSAGRLGLESSHNLCIGHTYEGWFDDSPYFDVSTPCRLWLTRLNLSRRQRRLRLLATTP